MILTKSNQNPQSKSSVECRSLQSKQHLGGPTQATSVAALIMASQCLTFSDMLFDVYPFQHLSLSAAMERNVKKHKAHAPYEPCAI
jgi:hypothetical protein